MGNDDKCKCINKICNADCKQNTLKSCNTDDDCREEQVGGSVIYKKDMSNIRYLSDLLDKWDNNTAKQYYDVIYSIYGFPYMTINKKGGLCVWKRDTIPENDIHYKIVLKDEAIKHSLPKSHIDYLYSHVKMYIPPDKLNTVQTISGSIGYDPLKNEVYARCGSFSANFATLRSIFDVLNDTRTDYKVNISNMDKEYNKNLSYIKKELKNNNDKYIKEMDLDCYPGAFPKECK